MLGVLQDKVPLLIIDIKYDKLIIVKIFYSQYIIQKRYEIFDTQSIR